MNSAADLASRIDVKNVSDKTIIEFNLGWLVISPEGCSERPIETVVDYAPVEEAVISPGDTSMRFSYKLGTRGTKMLTKDIGSQHLLILFGVVYVKFEDGSSWKYDLRKLKTFGDDTPVKEFACTANGAPVPSRGERCGKPFTLPGASIAGDGPTAERLSELAGLKPAANVIPDSCVQCEWNCNPTSNLKNCTIVYNPAPGCQKDGLGECCFTQTRPDPPYRVCYLHCCPYTCP